jgi:hypothetical protein
VQKSFGLKNPEGGGDGTVEIMREVVMIWRISHLVIRARGCRVRNPGFWCPIFAAPNLKCHHSGMIGAEPLNLALAPHTLILFPDYRIGRIS